MSKSLTNILNVYEFHGNLKKLKKRKYDSPLKTKSNKKVLRKKCGYSELFWQLLVLFYPLVVLSVHS